MIVPLRPNFYLHSRVRILYIYVSLFDIYTLERNSRPVAVVKGSVIGGRQKPGYIYTLLQVSATSYDSQDQRHCSRYTMYVYHPSLSCYQRVVCVYTITSIREEKDGLKGELG